MLQAVLFDLDGTLIDSAPGLGLALNLVLKEEGRPIVPLTQLYSYISNGAKGLLELGLGKKAESIADFERMRQRFLIHYEKVATYQCTLFVGIGQLLNNIIRHHLSWGIVTNKRQKYTNLMLPTLRFPCAPQVVVCGDTTAQSKPSAMPLLHAAQQLKIPTKSILYVGDAQKDILAGHKAGMRTAVVSWGYLDQDKNYCSLWNADYTAASTQELWIHIKHLLAKKN